MAIEQETQKAIQVGGQPIIFHPPVLSKDISVMDFAQLIKAASVFHDRIGEYCAYLAEILYMDPRLQEDLFARLQDTRRKIDAAKNTEDLRAALNDAIFQIHRIHVNIAQVQEFLSQKGQLSRKSIALVLLYVLIILGIILFGRGFDTTFTIPVIGIPVSVLLWSLIGSVAAILFRLYTYQITKLAQVSPEVSWMIYRPLTGIIMGLVTYVAIVAGLFLFGGDTQAAFSTSGIRPQLFWLVAFLAGFSDRFFEGFIHGLVNKLSNPTPELKKS